MSLSDLAGRMRSAGNDSYDYDDDEVQDALQTLADAFDNTDRETLREIMVDGNLPDNEDTLSEAVKNVTSESDIKSTFTEEWDNDVLRDIQYELKSNYNDIWENADEEIAEIKQVFVDNNISELNEMCAAFDFNEVADELGLDDSEAPDTYAECTSLVAKTQGVKSELTTMYLD